MTGTPLRIAIAGVGEIGLMHAANVLATDECELAALASSRPHRAGEAARSLPTAVAVSTYDEVFARPDVDAVIVTSRTPDHPAHAAAALRAGKHVLVEKPASATETGWQELRDAQAEHPDRILHVGYMRRFDPELAALRRHVEQGHIGNPLSVTLTNREHYPPSPGEDVDAKGGLLVDIGVHDFDAACWLLNAEPLRCYAAGSTERYPELAAAGDVDSAFVVLELRGGGVAQMHVSRAGIDGLDVACELHGSQGSLHLAPDDRSRLPEDYRERFAAAFRAELAAFAAACRGERRELPGLRDDERAVRIAFAARRSLESGRSEPVEP